MWEWIATGAIAGLIVWRDLSASLEVVEYADPPSRDRWEIQRSILFFVVTNAAIAIMLYLALGSVLLGEWREKLADTPNPDLAEAILIGLLYPAIAQLKWLTSKQQGGKEQPIGTETLYKFSKEYVCKRVSAVIKQCDLTFIQQEKRWKAAESFFEERYEQRRNDREILDELRIRAQDRCSQLGESSDSRQHDDATFIDKVYREAIELGSYRLCSIQLAIYVMYGERMGEPSLETPPTV